MTAIAQGDRDRSKEFSWAKMPSLLTYLAALSVPPEGHRNLGCLGSGLLHGRFPSRNRRQAPDLLHGGSLGCWVWHLVVAERLCERFKADGLEMGKRGP